MALINNIPVFVEREDETDGVEGTDHPVEKGLPLTDHIQRVPVELTITGKIVNVGKYKASDILAKIKQLKNRGSIITYIGRCYMGKMQIRSFTTGRDYTIWGGCTFSMTLKEVRIGKTAFIDKSKAKSGGTKQVEKGKNKNVYHTVKKGDCVWNLVTKKYKSLKRGNKSAIMAQCNWVMAKNPKAFSRKGDFGTLQIGKKILIGVRT